MHVKFVMHAQVSHFDNSSRQMRVEYMYWFPVLEFVLDYYVSEYILVA